jgi:DNA polymerase III sliding clamp (beta) subunit (PCNA family)
MKRTELLEKLNLIKPALSNSEHVPLTQHFWFFGLSVVAFNERIAMSTPCKTDFTGTLHGQTLIPMLETSSAKEAKMTKVDNQVFIKMRKTELKLGTLPIEDIFKMPKPDKSFKLDVDDMEVLVKALKGCMRSVTEEVTRGYTGVTFMPEGKTLSIFTTNGNAISYESIKLKSPLKNRVTLSPDFCKQLIELSGDVKRDDPEVLEIHDDYALYSNDKATLWGKLVVLEELVDFPGLMKLHFTSEYLDKLIAIPSTMKNILDRAIIILNDKTTDGNSNAVVREGKLTLKSESAKGVAIDPVDIAHPDIKVRFNPKWVRDGCDDFKRMYITNRSFIMTNEADTNSIYLIATSRFKEKDK